MLGDLLINVLACDISESIREPYITANCLCAVLNKAGLSLFPIHDVVLDIEDVNVREKYKISSWVGDYYSV